MESFTNLELLSVGVAIAGTALLGVVMLLNNPRSATNRSFFYFALVTVFWSIVNYLYYQLPASQVSFWILRLVIFFATWHAFTFCNFALVFPNDVHKPNKFFKYAFLPVAILVSLLTLTPLVFKTVNLISLSRNITGVQNGPAIPLFGVFVFATIVYGIFVLTKKTITTTKQLRRPYEFLLGGMTATFILLLTFNFLLPALFNNSKYIPLGALFLIPFVVCSAYAILHYRLFSIRVAAVAVLAFFLSTAVFLDIVFAQSLIGVLFTSSEFVLVLIFSFWLIQAVLREVKQREKIEKLATELEKANKQQIILIHFITHQIKGFVTKSRNIFSMMLEGDFGAVPDTMRPMVEEGFRSDTQGAQTIQEILTASNVKSGAVKYDMQSFDFSALVKETAGALKPNADMKKLEFTTHITEGLTITGDQMQLRNAIKNMIDNAIKYTPSGSVSITVEKDGELVRFIEQDTGVGITAEDMQHLFTEGGHGQESIKVNVESTGFGLYIVKNIITAHNGKVWAESEGAGKGSEFIIELPMTPPTA
jgi:signal transduction histidine kinase